MPSLLLLQSLMTVLSRFPKTESSCRLFLKSEPSFLLSYSLVPARSLSVCMYMGLVVRPSAVERPTMEEGDELAP